MAKKKSNTGIWVALAALGGGALYLHEKSKKTGGYGYTPTGAGGSERGVPFSILPEPPGWDNRGYTSTTDGGSSTSGGGATGGGGGGAGGGAAGGGAGGGAPAVPGPYVPHIRNDIIPVYDVHTNPGVKNPPPPPPPRSAFEIIDEQIRRWQEWWGHYGEGASRPVYAEGTHSQARSSHLPQLDFDLGGAKPANRTSAAMGTTSKAARWRGSRYDLTASYLLGPQSRRAPKEFVYQIPGGGYRIPPNPEEKLKAYTGPAGFHPITRTNIVMV